MNFYRPNYLYIVIEYNDEDMFLTSHKIKDIMKERKQEMQNKKTNLSKQSVISALTNDNNEYASYRTQTHAGTYIHLWHKKFGYHKYH